MRRLDVLQAAPRPEKKAGIAKDFFSPQNIGLFKEKAILWIHEKELVNHCKRPRFVKTAGEEDSWKSVQSLSQHEEASC